MEKDKIEDATLLAKIMIAGFDKILMQFREQFSIFLKTIPKSIVDAVEKAKAKEGI